MCGCGNNQESSKSPLEIFSDRALKNACSMHIWRIFVGKLSGLKFTCHCLSIAVLAMVVIYGIRVGWNKFRAYRWVESESGCNQT
jgi:hypothetical protein